jgi:hypothetical protein
VYFFNVLFLHMYKNVTSVACSSVCHTLPVTVDTRCNINKEINIKIYVLCVCVRTHACVCVCIYIRTHCDEASYLCVFAQACWFKFLYSSCGSLYS